MRWSTYSLFTGLAFFARANALLESQAGVIDWHKAHIGVPLTHTLASAPSLHAPPRKSRSKTKTPPGHGLLISGTESNVLGAVHANNGSVAWRWIYEPDDPILEYQKHDNIVASLSGPGGAILRTFESSTGALISETHLHRPESARLLEPDYTGTSIVFTSPLSDVTPSVSDLVVLTEGHVVRRLDSAGKKLWQWISPDQTSQIIYSKIVATPTTVYVVGLSKSFAAYTVHVTSLSMSTGEQLASVNIPSTITEGPSSLLSLSLPSATTGPRIVWLETGTIKSVELTDTLTSKPVSVKGAYESIVDVGLEDKGYFVALKAGDGSGRVVKLADGDKDGLKVVWEFDASARSTTNTESMYVGGLDGEGFPYIARVFWTHVLKKGSAHVYAPHLAEGKGLVSGFTFAFDTDSHGVMAHVALQVPYPQAYDLVPYLAVTTSTGALQLWQGDRLLWTREESLANIAVAEMVELPEARDILSSSGEHRKETFTERISRQIIDLKGLPSYLVHFATRFATGSYASTAPVPVSVSTAATNETRAIVELARDEFGFRKIIIAATEYGKVYGLDSSNGEIVWSRVFGLGWAAEVGARIVPVKIYTVKAVGDEEGAAPEVVIVTQRIADNGLVDTVLFHLNALTGGNVREDEKKGALLQGFDIIQGPIVDAYLLPTDEAKVLVILDEFVQIYLYPETAATNSLFTSLSSSMSFPLRTGRPGARQLTGHIVNPESGLSGRHTVSGPTWQTSLPPSHDIIDIIRKPRDPVASLGKVLGNRTTLYKYLNPTLFAVLSGGTNDCAVSVIDGAKGTLLYSVVLPSAPSVGGAEYGAKGSCDDVKASFVENWLVYSYWDGESKGVGEAKGYRMVSVELYEGKGPDDKTRSSDMTSFSDKSLDVRAISQSFVFPHGITAMTTTSTKFGVTMKDLVVANVKNQIQSFPRRLLDPRRPKQKPTAEEQEEMLFQYDPLIPDDPRRVLSHTYEVANVRRIITSPALLESTSLVFAYGIDLFFTRVTPSNTFDILSENFNKAQLVLTITGLAVAIFVTKPMVARKKLRERWY